MATLTERLIELRDIRERRDDANAEYESLKAEYKEMEAELIEQMKEEGAEGVKAKGINFVPASTPYAQVQDAAEFMEWAEEQDENLLEQKPRKELLNQLIREHLDDGRPLPPGLGFYVREYISQRAA